MDHPRCKTCKHFRSEGNIWDTPDDFGCCTLIEMTCEMTGWDDSTDKLVTKARYREHLAGVMDGSSYHAALYPSGEFYCPMHSDLMPQLMT